MAPTKQLSGQSHPSKAEREHKGLFLDRKVRIIDLLKSVVSLAKGPESVSSNPTFKQ